MTSDLLHRFKHILIHLPGWLKRAFDEVALWVTQMSWKKFMLVALLLVIAGSILQDILFPPQSKTVNIKQHSNGKNQSKTISDRDTDIRIDSSGIYIRKNNSAGAPAAPATPALPGVPGIPAVPAKPGIPGVPGVPGVPAQDGKPAIPAIPAVPAVPPELAIPAVPAIPPKPAEPATANGELHISLPPEIGKEVSDAIDDAVDDAAAARTEDYRKESSTWFMNFVLLLLVGLFATKALMGGKKRAEITAASAQQSAEREALQRQVSEAKMQMMQAQVEPHFLFNTLASVEHLIETDPPRASAMQRKLIQYLRAVLPQMRGTGTLTNLGREADMVAAYLELLKMRMEDRLQVRMQISDGLRSAAFPPMMLQPLVENAIKHGLEGKAEGGTLEVLAEVVNGKLQVSVTDDGLGFGALPSDGTGLGLQSIRERLKLLHSGQSQLIITPNQPTGVKASIEVPYIVAPS